MKILKSVCVVSWHDIIIPLKHKNTSFFFEKKEKQENVAQYYKGIMLILAKIHQEQFLYSLFLCSWSIKTKRVHLNGSPNYPIIIDEFLALLILIES